MSQSKKENTTQDNPQIYPIAEDQSSKFLAISRLSGSNLYAKKFDDSLKYDEQLLGLGINALRIFLLDSFKRTNITSINVDELTVRMANIDDIIVYYIYTGLVPEQETRFTHFVERLVAMDCWGRFSESEYNIYKRDTKSISLVVEEIFGG
ncbi:MAG: hypothetical protein GPJ54_06225 [Candidatus Heimdallarchaeota archaeon]|nr:hypothetical protein [Candidatus Heimdallarchaeota archaeon]